MVCILGVFDEEILSEFWMIKEKKIYKGIVYKFK